ncbi:GNAT family N-acetyltransferase [Mesotoga sp.]|uniref:GNAT family N-acetyltransferase n=1 Tax=Mesotoga sp. TaxID=2053577 RepID=UPI00345EE60F
MRGRIRQRGILQSPRAFKEPPLTYGAFENCKELGLILFEREWNNSLRIWDILVWEEYRQMEVGKKLMDAARDYAISANMRRLVLESQSCNYPAISFCLKYGFELLGFDTACYSKRDIEKHELHHEFRYLL